MVGARRLAPAFAPSYGGAGVQGCLVLSQVGLLFPVNHASVFAQKLRRTGPRLSMISRGAGSQKHAQTRS
jgi:hypothetical protein